MAEITCKQCGKELGSEEVNIQTCLAKCSSCGAVSWLSKPEIEKEPSRDFKNVDKPKDTEVTQDMMGLTIEKKQPVIAGIIILFFSAFWNIIVVVMASSMINSMDSGLLFLAPLIPFLLIGLIMLYFGITFLVNKTCIRVTQGELKLYHSPLPFPGRKQLNRSDISQLFVKESLHRRSSSSNGSHTSSTYYSYDVMVIGQNGKRLKLIALTKAQDALFFERTIEKYLYIRDERVDGEIDGSRV